MKKVSNSRVIFDFIGFVLLEVEYIWFGASNLSRLYNRLLGFFFAAKILTSVYIDIFFPQMTRILD